MPFKEGNWCIQCGRLDVEFAASNCTKPKWHIPNSEGRISSADDDWHAHETNNNDV